MSRSSPPAESHQENNDDKTPASTANVATPAAGTRGNNSNRFFSLASHRANSFRKAFGLVNNGVEQQEPETAATNTAQKDFTPSLSRATPGSAGGGSSSSTLTSSYHSETKHSDAGAPPSQHRRKANGVVAAIKRTASERLNRMTKASIDEAESNIKPKPALSLSEALQRKQSAEDDDETNSNAVLTIESAPIRINKRIGGKKPATFGGGSKEIPLETFPAATQKSPLNPSTTSPPLPSPQPKMISPKTKASKKALKKSVAANFSQPNGSDNGDKLRGFDSPRKRRAGAHQQQPQQSPATPSRRQASRKAFDNNRRPQRSHSVPIKRRSRGRTREPLQTPHTTSTIETKPESATEQYTSETAASESQQQQPASPRKRAAGSTKKQILENFLTGKDHSSKNKLSSSKSTGLPAPVQQATDISVASQRRKSSAVAHSPRRRSTTKSAIAACCDNQTIVSTTSSAAISIRSLPPAVAQQARSSPIASPRQRLRRPVRKKTPTKESHKKDIYFSPLAVEANQLSDVAPAALVNVSPNHSRKPQANRKRGKSAPPSIRKLAGTFAATAEDEAALEAEADDEVLHWSRQGRRKLNQRTSSDSCLLDVPGFAASMALPEGAESKHPHLFRSLQITCGERSGFAKVPASEPAVPPAADANDDPATIPQSIDGVSSATNVTRQKAHGEPQSKSMPPQRTSPLLSPRTKTSNARKLTTPRGTFRKTSSSKPVDSPCASHHRTAIPPPPSFKSPGAPASPSKHRRPRRSASKASPSSKSPSSRGLLRQNRETGGDMKASIESDLIAGDGIASPVRQTRKQPSSSTTNNSPATAVSRKTIATADSTACFSQSDGRPVASPVDAKGTDEVTKANDLKRPVEKNHLVKQSLRTCASRIRNANASPKSEPGVEVGVTNASQASTRVIKSMQACMEVMAVVAGVDQSAEFLQLKGEIRKHLHRVAANEVGSSNSNTSKPPTVPQLTDSKPERTSSDKLTSNHTDRQRQSPATINRRPSNQSQQRRASFGARSATSCCSVKSPIHVSPKQIQHDPVVFDGWNDPPTVVSGTRDQGSENDQVRPAAPSKNDNGSDDVKQVFDKIDSSRGHFHCTEVEYEFDSSSLGSPTAGSQSCSWSSHRNLNSSVALSCQSSTSSFAFQPIENLEDVMSDMEATAKEKAKAAKGEYMHRFENEEENGEGVAEHCDPVEFEFEEPQPNIAGEAAAHGLSRSSPQIEEFPNAFESRTATEHKERPALSSQGEETASNSHQVRKGTLDSIWNVSSASPRQAGAGVMGRAQSCSFVSGAADFSRSPLQRAASSHAVVEQHGATSAFFKPTSSVASWTQKDGFESAFDPQSHATDSLDQAILSKPPLSEANSIDDDVDFWE